MNQFSWWQEAPCISLVHNKTSVVRLRIHKGQIVQDCDVYIGRRQSQGGWNLPESIWHNPYKLKDYNNDIRLVCYLYELYLLNRPDLLARLSELRRKRLGCFCDVNAGALCHGLVLCHYIDKL